MEGVTVDFFATVSGGRSKSITAAERHERGLRGT